MRLRVSAVYPFHCSGIWCSAWAVVSCRVTVAWIFCGRGATLVTARETQCLPALRGSNQRAAAPATLFRPPGRPCRKESKTFSLIPFGFCGSRRQWVVSPRTRVSGARAVEDNQSSRLQKLREPETTAEQPAPVSTKVPRPVHSGQPALKFGTGFYARDRCRATSPRVYKSSCNSKTGTPGDNQSHSEPALPV